MNNSGRVDIKLVFGAGISIFFLVLLFRQVDYQKLLIALKSIDYRLLVAAVVVTLISYSLRAIRWHYLILPHKVAKPRNLLSATIICYMVNNLLPARLGEFARAVVFARKESMETSTVFATLVIDRLFDGFSVLLILLYTFFTVKLPPGMESLQQGLLTGGYVTLSLYIAVIVFLVLLKKSTEKTISFVDAVLKPLPWGLSGKVIPLINSFITGIKLPARRRHLIALTISCIFIWGTAAWPIDLVLQAFDIHLPFTASLFILVFLVFAVMVPSSPGYIGTYHAASMYGLMAFSLPKEQALSVAIVLHAVAFFPVIIYGFFFIWRDRISFSSIKTLDANKE